ncbi:MAG: tRNA 2-thiocytidine biosynthesis protein TtcA [Chlamydiae bacterium]|nr:tRNA 2-thiocytidine biosynthesis protein TtcA [Chlamydiota bacterium]
MLSQNNLFPKPPFSGTGKTLESLCRKALYDFHLLDGIDHLGIALSGGKDSLTLLFLLHAISGRGFNPFKITAFHVTGAFSCGPSMTKDYLQSVCDAMDIRLVVKNSTQTLEKLACYPCSRERRKLLFDAAREHNITTIAFGHHKDDSVETLLLNLLHKGEFAANLPKLPMQKMGVTIIRPLIYASEKQIEAFARRYNFLRMMCQCPVGATSQRKTVKDILDYLETHFPNTRENLSLASLTYGSKKALIP